MMSTAVLTFTETDLRLAFEHLEADLRAIAQRTGLRTSSWAVELAADVRTLAVAGYLEQLDLMLYDEYGREVRGRTYAVDDGGSGTGDTSGGNRWPRMPGGKLSSVVTYNDAWWDLTSSQRCEFKRTHLLLTWTPSDIDTSHSSLSMAGERDFAQNAARIRRRDYA